MSDTLLAGMAGGMMASGDPRKASRRMMSMIFIIASVVGLAATIGMWIAMDWNVANYILGTLFWGWVTVVAVAKWVCAFPFSTFRLVSLAISAVKISTAAKVWLIALGALWVIGSIFAATTHSVATVVIFTILFFVAAWGAGSTIGKVEGKVWMTMQEARVAVARALNVAPERLEASWSGKLHDPLFTFQFPTLIAERDLATVSANFMSLQTPFTIRNIVDRGIDVAIKE